MVSGVRIEILMRQVVRADVHLRAGRHLHLLVLIERRAGDADEDQHDAEVHDVAAVAARVAHGELRHAPRRCSSPVRAEITRAPR